jgi:carbon-monoxide dehydrogenase iron sulfur subunit
MKRILVDDAKCLACHSCELACAAAHSDSKTLYGAISEEILPLSRIHVEPGGRGRGFPLGCRHCQEPQCARACVTKALSVSADGAVLYEKKLCIGCQMCVIACPFGAVEEGRQKSSVSKCDLCAASDREPACATACPTKALVFEEVDEFSQSKRRKYIVEMEAPSQEIL